MELILSMLPIYFLGNVHCMGMCGPLAMLLAKHPFRMAYFLGRISAFTFIGMLVGEMGAAVQVFLNQYHISAVTSLLFGGVILIFALNYFSFISFPKSKKIMDLFKIINQKVSLLILKQNFSSAYYFGLATPLLPCGQSLMIFSVSAILANPWLGALNSFVFAMLTTPSLWLSMRASSFLLSFAKNYRWIMGVLLFVVAFLALWRGFNLF